MNDFQMYEQVRKEEVFINSVFLCSKENQKPFKRCKEQCGWCEGVK